MKGGFVIPIRSIVLASGGSSATIAFNKIGRLTPMSRPEIALHSISKNKCFTILATLDSIRYINIQIRWYHKRNVSQNLKIIVRFMTKNQSMVGRPPCPFFWLFLLAPRKLT